MVAHNCTLSIKKTGAWGLYGKTVSKLKIKYGARDVTQWYSICIVCIRSWLQSPVSKKKRKKEVLEIDNTEAQGASCHTHSKYPAVTVHARTSPFSHCLVCPCSSNAGKTTCSRSSSRDSSLTGASLQQLQVYDMSPISIMIYKTSNQIKQISKANEPIVFIAFLPLTLQVSEAILPDSTEAAPGPLVSMPLCSLTLWEQHVRAAHSSS